MQQTPDTPRPPCLIAPVIGADASTVVGWCVVCAVTGARVGLERPTKADAAIYAEGLGFDPWLSDEEHRELDELRETWPGRVA